MTFRTSRLALASLLSIVAAAVSPVAADPVPNAAGPGAPSASESAQPAPSQPSAAPATPADPNAAPAAAAVAVPQLPPPSPVSAAITAALADKSVTGKSNTDDIGAVKAFYAARSDYVFATASGWTEKGAALIAEIKKADDYGLEASAFALPDLMAGADIAAKGAADVKLALAALTYARYARGGRFDPQSVSNILDVRGDIKDPTAVMAELAASVAPDSVLRGLHPKHKEFEALRQALLKARGPAPAVAEPEIDPALKIKLPEGKQTKSLKPGVEHDDVVLLRQRLKVASAESGNNRLYDTTVEAAVSAFQDANALKPNGVLNNRTRQALNREGEPKPAADPSREVDQIIVNMERWRWLPNDMGPIYVWNNIPEYMGRVIANDAVVFEEKIIVGLPTWPTPMMTDSMEKIVFNPEWGVPDGIKVKELLPRLRKASGGDFFEQLFSGGSSGGGRVLAAYGLKPSLNGRPVDADSVNWNQVDIRRYSFTQPAGAQNPLGTVKFMFPNRHDVYMHDTSQRPLFQQARRALSHGCIRVENPRTLAEILLAQDKGWSAEKVASMYGGGTNEVLLDKPIPVYLTYFTARPGPDGKIKSSPDIYGHDGRLMSALAGRPVRYEPPQGSADDVVADATPTGYPAETSSTNKKKSKKSKSYDGDIISNALSGLLFN
ncbi:MAG: murein L,D-transpeptidase [Hyphomicrobium sp.]